MDAQLCVKKKVSQCTGTCILPGRLSVDGSRFLADHNNNNYLTKYKYDFLVLFYLH